MRGTQQSAFSKLVHVKSKWDPRLGAGGDGCLCVVLVRGGEGATSAAHQRSTFIAVHGMLQTRHGAGSIGNENCYV